MLKLEFIFQGLSQAEMDSTQRIKEEMDSCSLQIVAEHWKRATASSVGLFRYFRIFNYKIDLFYDNGDWGLLVIEKRHHIWD